MKRLAVILALTLIGAPNCFAAWTHIKSCQGDVVASPITCTFGSNIGAGHMTVFGMYVSNGAGASISGDGDTYVQVGSTQAISGGATLLFFYVTNTTGGSATITASFTSISFGSIIGEEYSGQLTSGALDQNTFGSCTVSCTSPSSSGNVTTTANGELVFGYHWDNVGGQAAGSGFTQRTSDATGVDEDLTEDLVQGTAGTTSATASYTGGGDWGIFVATFKPATGAGGSVL